MHRILYDVGKSHAYRNMFKWVVTDDHGPWIHGVYQVYNIHPSTLAARSCQCLLLVQPMGPFLNFEITA